MYVNLYVNGITRRADNIRHIQKLTKHAWDLVSPILS